MSLDSVAAIQARIQQIEQSFGPAGTTPSTSSDSSSSTTGTDALAFSDLLAAASSLTGDSTDQSTTSSGLASLVANALGTGSAFATSTTSAAPASSSAANQKFIQNALAMNGDAYVYGASASPLDPHPKAFDCS